MEKQEKEKKLFEELLEEQLEQRREDCIPVPYKLLRSSLKCTVVGFMMTALAGAFTRMVDSNGKSNWEVDVSQQIGDKLTAKRNITKNNIRKMILQCQEKRLLEYAKEVDGKIIVKINVEYLFDEFFKGEK